MFIYSYSGRGFPDLAARYAETQGLAPTHLVSLYDLHHHLLDEGTQGVSGPQARGRFLDSGNYEVARFADTLEGEAPPGQLPWSAELYVASAKAHAREGDVLVSLDDRSLPVEDQIKQARALFRRIGLPGVKQDLLLHPNGTDPEALASIIASHAPQVEIVGLTEKDIGIPWFLAVAYLRGLRRALNTALGRYVLIHVFGCLDPRTLPYLFLSGADMFDGLAWMRYYFHKGHAYYAKEFEYEASPEELLDPAKATWALLQHNVAELEQLRSDLQYFVLTGDYTQLQACLEDLCAMEEVSVDAPPSATETDTRR